MWRNIMAYTQNNILNRLAGLDQTNFEVTDVKVRDEEVVWQIELKKDAMYQCRDCGAKHNSFHNRRWITIKDMPFGNKRCIWKVKRMRVLCTCTNNVRVEALPFRSKHHYLTQRFVNYIG